MWFKEANLGYLFPPTGQILSVTEYTDTVADDRRPKLLRLIVFCDHTSLYHHLEAFIANRLSVRSVLESRRVGECSSL